MDMKRIMRKTTVVIVAAGLMMFGLAGPALADGEGHDGPVPEHGHVLIIGLELAGEDFVGFRKCVDLAAGRALKNIAHHDGIHTGTAGKYALLTKAGHAVGPTAPLWPGMGGCSDLEAMFGR
jgi:hypothetical protein